MKLNIATLAVILVVLIPFAFLVRVTAWTPMRVVGIFITALGLVSLVVARLQLGDAFSVKAKASTLVTTGVYARIRNPIYVFSALALFGAILYSDKPRWLGIFAVIIPVQIYRSRNEARVLEQKFGSAYREYRQRTWF